MEIKKGEKYTRISPGGTQSIIVVQTKNQVVYHQDLADNHGFIYEKFEKVTD